MLNIRWVFTAKDYDDDDFSFHTFLPFCRSLRQMSRGGAQINYREEEKKILDSILGKDVYDNRIRPSGHNGTGMKFFMWKKSCKFFLMSAHLGTKNMIVLFLYDNVFMWQKRKVFNMFFVLPDAATIIVVNLYIRSFAKIDDVKMVRWKLCHKMLVELQKYFWM